MKDTGIYEKISEFKGEYRFLSNFYPAEFYLWNIRWPDSETAYQAAKCKDRDDALKFLECKTPGEAKKLGRRVIIRKDWEFIKQRIMLDVVREKFAQNPKLLAKLCATAGSLLEEGNTWNDHYWGVCPPNSGNGQNMLGKVLMYLRDVEFNNEQ